MADKIYIKPGCISCGNCEAVCPKVFKVGAGGSQVVKQPTDADMPKVEQAIKECPVQVIAKEGGGQSESAPASQKMQFIGKTQLTSDVYQFDFALDHLEFSPGQYLILKLGEGLARCYSIAGFHDGVVNFLIKVNHNSDSSKALLALEKDQEVEYMGPAGHFVLQESDKPKVLIATGTGLAPMVAILKHLQAHRSQLPVKVLMGVRSEKDIFYKEELEGFANVELIYTLSKPGEDWQGYKGRVTEHLDKVAKDEEVYICGAPAVVESTYHKLLDQGHPDQLIFKEEFSKAVAQSDAAATEKQGHHLPAFLQPLKSFFVDGEIPYAQAIRRMIFFSAFAVPLGLPWLNSGFRELGSIGWALLIALMFVRPLSDLFPQVGLLKALVPWRKEVGILSGILLLAHAYGYFLDGKLSITEELGQASYWALDSHFMWATVGMAAGTIVLVISNKFSMRMLGLWWKRIQQLAYLFFFGGAIHIYLINGKEEILAIAVAVAILWVLARLGIEFKLDLKK